MSNDTLGLKEYVIKRKSHRSSRGSAFVWTIVWLAGMAAIAWATLNFAIPKFEQKLQTTVNNAVETINESPIVVAVKGQHVTLSGELDSEENRLPIIAAVQSTWGALSIRDELSSTQSPESGDESLTPTAQLDKDNTAAGLADSDSQDAEPGNPAIQLAVANTGNTEGDPTESATSSDEPGDSESDSATPVTEDASLGMPSIDISIAGEILALEGVLAPTDDPSEMIEIALTSFNLDIVSNGIEERDDVSSSEWMTAIKEMLPAMSKLSNPRINVLEKQITISGVAANSQIHDSVIGAALSSLGQYSLVERISIDESIANATEEARIAAELKAAEEERLAAEAKAAEDARLAAEAKAAEEERLAAEAKAAEEERLAAEAKAAEEARLAAEAKAAEEERLAAEAKAAEEERLAAEAKAAEEERLAAEAKAAEEERLAAEAKAAEEERLAAEAKAAEEARLAAEAKAAEEERLAAEAKAAEEARLAAEAKAAEEERLAAEAKAAEEERLAAEAKAAEEERLTAEAKAAEEERLAAEAKPDEEERLAIAARSASLSNADSAKPVQALQKDSAALRDALAALPSLRILFESNSNVFTQQSIETLDKIAEVLMQFSDTKVSIEGHTDATGTRAANLELSLLRATTVRDYLINKGVSVYSLRALGFGEELPIANNRTVEGRATNRRIDFKF